MKTPKIPSGWRRLKRLPPFAKDGDRVWDGVNKPYMWLTLERGDPLIAGCIYIRRVPASEGKERGA